MDCVRIGISKMKRQLRDEGIDPGLIDVFELTKLMMLMHLAEPEQVSYVIETILEYDGLNDSYVKLVYDGIIKENLDYDKFEYMWSFSTGCCSGRYHEMLMKEMGRDDGATSDS